MVYTKEFLIRELQRFVDEFCFVPTQKQMDTTEGYPSSGIYKYYFKTFNKALEVANLSLNRTHEKRTEFEICCKCGNHLKQGQYWQTKELPKGKVMCISCYYNPDYKNGKLDKQTNIGKGTISEQIVKNVLNLEERYDCNFACGFNYPVDLYHKDKYKYINVKDSKLHYSIYQNSRWCFNLSQKVTPDTYIMLGYDENRKHILHVWITDPLDDLTYDIKNEELKKSLTITNISKSLKLIKPWEVDVKPYNDMLHLMSQKRKDTNGKECFLSNDDLVCDLK